MKMPLERTCVSIVAEALAMLRFDRMRPSFRNDRTIIFSFFIAAILLGSALLSLPAARADGRRISGIDAIFTATSAVCVTGLAVVDTAGFSAFGLLILLTLIQLGGLGIVSFAALYVAMPRRRISLSSGGIMRDMFVDDVESRPRAIIRNVLAWTFGLEFAGCVALLAAFKVEGIPCSAFDAAFHAVSAFCNAGFSTFPNGLSGLDSHFASSLVVMTLVVLGGIGFTVLGDLMAVIAKRRRRLSYHTRVVILINAALIIVGTVGFFLFEHEGAYKGMDAGRRVTAALFQSVTTRTAGFDTVPPAMLGGPSIFLALLLMFSGGSPGSTAGGVKTTTVFMALAAGLKGAEDDGSIAFKGGIMPAGLVARAFSVLARAVLLLSAAFVALMVFEGGRYAFGDVLFEAVSAFGTVGLSRGLTQSLLPASKAVLIATMFAGRVGLFAMALPRSAERIERFAEFPTENILLG